MWPRSWLDRIIQWKECLELQRASLLLWGWTKWQTNSGIILWSESPPTEKHSVMPEPLIFLLITILGENSTCIYSIWLFNTVLFWVFHFYKSKSIWNWVDYWNWEMICPRIKMCTVKTHESLIIIHHEMGHIQYFMEYQDQPVNFRQGANPGVYQSLIWVSNIWHTTEKYILE